MRNFLVLSICAIFSNVYSQWDTGWFPNPDNYVPKYNGKSWQRLGWMSDGFNDGWLNETKWKRGYLNEWNDKGRTRWNSWPDYVKVSNTWGQGCAQIGHYWNDASAGGWANTISCGIISSRNTVKYPVYLESRIRVANTELSSNFWLLDTGENRREIDVLECYGGNSWNGNRATSNFHFFTDSDRKDHFKRSDHWRGFPWRNNFHRFGVLWLNPWDVRFFIDGKREGYNFYSINLKTKDGLQLNKDWWNYSTEMKIILDVEEHKGTAQDPIWKYKQGLWNTDRKMLVDWIGVWKPNTGGKKLNTSSINTAELPKVYPNPVKQGQELVLSNIEKGQNFIFSSVDGKIISSFNIPHEDKLFLNTKDISPGLYILQVDTNVIKLIVK
ncbi:T9SS type A sorting domain-containing protein [Aquimarina agarilytica]|uniref:T9SS type A sorting domain-containing protein n=1 Tax=Aquimarina agarilytica TaxID=1087449 RepID=UPI00028A12FB|nr:T9SS type A sorting domain-containing protein [Aquimarina agarilytica]